MNQEQLQPNNPEILEIAKIEFLQRHREWKEKCIDISDAALGYIYKFGIPLNMVLTAYHIS